MVWQALAQLNHTIFENADPRVSEWPMMQSPIPTLIICLFYVYVVKYSGPSYMKNREPLNIRWLLVFYNFSMVIFNFLIFYQYGVHGWFGSYSYRCQPVDYSHSPQAIGMANVCWWFYISKFVELSDTIFFVMRKKFNQISTLHVVHHGILPMSIWLGLRFTPGGHSTFFAFVNSFIHVLMYLYYGLAAIGPQMYKYLWWKKYMTTLQMVQFVFIFIHSFQLLFVSCNYPIGFMFWIGFHAALFWFLFADFYKNTYSKNTASKASNGNTKASKEDSQSLPVKNGFMNGHSVATNGYAGDKNGVLNGNGLAHSSTTESQLHFNGHQHGNNVKKIK